MKFLLLIASFIPVFVFAQNYNRDVLNPEQLEVKKIKLDVERIASPDIKLPFKNIRIIDSRFDTSKMGYVLGSVLGKKRNFRKMHLEGGSGKAIENYYNEYYREAFAKNDFELLIVMKRFWLSGNAVSNSKRVELYNSVLNKTSLYCKWEYYIGKQGYYLPVKRKDTIIEIGEDLGRYINEEYGEKKHAYFKYALREMVEMLDYSNAIIQFDNKPKKTLAQIEEFNHMMNNVPVLQDSAFKKGVYLSFEDFKNNRPSIADFQVKEMHYGRLNVNTEIYLEDMNEQTISKYWGYSDGTDFRYGMLGNEKMFRIQNTFCFFIKVIGYSVSQGDQGRLSQPGINGVSKDKYESWVPFQIDMETGDIY